MLGLATLAPATREEERTFPDHLFQRGLNLGFTAARAITSVRGRWISSIAGPLSNLLADPAPGTEGAALRWRDPAGRKALARALFPRVFVPGEASDRSGPFDTLVGAAPLRAGERWFFINGICSNRAIAALNAQELSALLQRPLQVLYNATDGWFFDLLECAAGKALELTTEAARPNLAPLVDALCDPTVKRVGLISHSQGTILAAVLLKSLEEAILKRERAEREQKARGAAFVHPKPRSPDKRVSPERLAARRLIQEHTEDPAVTQALVALQRSDIGKLEMYCFANCATSMEPFVSIDTGSFPPRHAPWIESYGNEFDLVAQLGVLSPTHGIGGTRILGDRYVRKGVWGHLLNAHYLAPLVAELAGNAATALEPFHDNLLATPRLYGYFDGKVPA